MAGMGSGEVLQVTTPRKTAVLCIYCGESVRKVRRGEHIVAEAIGGKLTISEVCEGRNVCNKCNNGVLSEVDRELCSRSGLSMIAGQQLDAFIWQTWDVDHGENNLLVEAEPDFSGQSMTLFPQMIFESAGPQLRGDQEQLQRFGSENFQKVFIRFMLEAFHEFESGKTSRLNPKKVSASAALRSRYRYPPRIFARRPIEQFASGMSFELQYLTSAERRFALSQLEKWDTSKSFRNYEVGIGSELPTFSFSFDAGKVLRALAKQAVNLLAAYCPNTPVDREGFQDVIRVVLCEIPVSPELLCANGFVHAADIQPIKVENAHSFRLLHMDGHWHIYSSFFGGRIGAFVRFPGPNGEEWCCADIAMPLDSKTSTIRTGRVLQPLRVRIEWKDPAKIMPSVELLNAESEMRVEAVQKPNR